MSEGHVILKTVVSVVIVALAVLAGMFALLLLYPLLAKPALLAFLVIAYADLVLILILSIWSKTLLRRLRFIPLIVLVVCLLGGGALGGYYLWESNLPQVSDQLVLREYLPFDPEASLARLEGAAALRLEKGLPRLDCATALYPLTAAFAEAVYPAGENYNPYDPESVVQCNGTTFAYERLIAGEADMIIVAGPSDVQRRMAENAGAELILTPIGLESFIFFVNARNPVDGLTADQLRGIYSGEITSWAQVGGKSKAIRAFQRPKNSGSQTALEAFMGDTPLMEPPAENVADLMGGIIRRTASYRNHNNAIGYSFRYYSTQMVKNDQIKLLAVDGVFPAKETIRDKSYPIADPYFAITVKGRETQETQALIDWILSHEGQFLTEETGYVAISPENP